MECRELHFWELPPALDGNELWVIVMLSAANCRQTECKQARLICLGAKTRTQSEVSRHSHASAVKRDNDLVIPDLIRDLGNYNKGEVMHSQRLRIKSAMTERVFAMTRW